MEAKLTPKPPFATSPHTGQGFFEPLKLICNKYITIAFIYSLQNFAGISGPNLIKSNQYNQ
jgi:hypothetical protein